METSEIILLTIQNTNENLNDSSTNQYSTLAQEIIKSSNLATFGFENQKYGYWDAFVSIISQFAFKLGIPFFSNRDEGKLTAATKAVDAFQEVMKKGEKKDLNEASNHLNEITAQITEANVHQALFNHLLAPTDNPHAEKINEELTLLYTKKIPLDELMGKKELLLVDPDCLSNKRLLDDYRMHIQMLVYTDDPELDTESRLKQEEKTKQLKAQIALRAFKIIEKGKKNSWEQKIQEERSIINQKLETLNKEYNEVNKSDYEFPEQILKQEKTIHENFMKTTFAMQAKQQPLSDNQLMTNYKSNKLRELGSQIEDLKSKEKTPSWILQNQLDKQTKIFNEINNLEKESSSKEIEQFLNNKNFKQNIEINSEVINSQLQKTINPNETL